MERRISWEWLPSWKCYVWQVHDSSWIPELSDFGTWERMGDTRLLRAKNLDPMKKELWKLGYSIGELI